MLRTELRDFPSRKIAVNTIEKGGVGSHFRREGIKKAAGFQKHIDALIDITDEYHGGAGGLFFLAAGKGTGSHIVFHDLDAVFILKLNPGNFVKGNAVPQAYESH